MLVDVLRYEQPDGSESYKACEAGEGRVIVGAHERYVRRRRWTRLVLLAVLGLVVVGYGLVILQRLVVTVGGLLVVVLLVAVGELEVGEPRDPVPEIVEESVRLVEAERRYDLDVTPS